MVFQQGADGYFPKPGGPRCTLVHRDDDERVPLLEIEKALMHLEISLELFWNIKDHAHAKTVEPKQDQSKSAHASSNPK